MQKKISVSKLTQVEIKDNFSLKEEMVLNWLIEARKFLLENNLATFDDIMPSKKEIGEFLGVSTGCVQNAVRQAEDMGYFISKQCIGTMIADMKNFNAPFIKMFSKKDKAVIEIKKHLILRGYSENEIIPSVIELAHEIKTSTNTCRLAVMELIREGVLRKEIYKKNVMLFLNSKIKLTEKEKNEIKNRNLVKILKEKIKKHIVQNYKTGDKIPTNLEFAKMFNVSVRTVNIAMKELNKDKTILSRRGNYGSVFLNTNSKDTRSEKSMFMSGPKQKKEVKKNYSYKWESAYTNIKQYILKNHEAGDKILSMMQFATMLNTSVTTVKKAVSELSKEGILYAQKVKYGGLFVNEMPQKEDSYQWLAINPKYFD